MASRIADEGRFTPVFLFDGDLVERDVARARSAGFACLDRQGQAIGEPSATRTVGSARLSWLARAAQLARRVPGWIRAPLGDVLSLASFGPRLAADLRRIARTREQFAALLARHAVRLVIAPGDNVGYATPILFQAAHRAGIRALVIPFTVSNRLEMVADRRRYRRFSLARLENRVTAMLYPHWAFAHDGHTMVRVEASQALALQWHGLAPPDPWVLNSGSADALAVESEFMAEYYRRAGLDEAVFRMTGTLGDDVVASVLADHDTKREQLCAELGIPGDRKIVLFSYGEYHYFFQTGRPSEFSSQRELTEFWTDALLAMPGFSVVLSLHPSVDPADAAHLERCGLKISNRTIEELVPLCDVYAVSISATVRTAIACGKPVVDHDVFDFDYDNFVGLDAVWIAKSKAEFREALARLADPAFYRDAVAAQQRIAPRFGKLDGHATERILALVDELAHGS